MIVPLPNKFSPDNPGYDPNILAKLATSKELSGLLNLALVGLKRLEARGSYERPKSTEEEIKKYQLESDSALQFFDECCKPVSKSIILRITLYNAYRDFCQDNGYKPLGAANFNKRLKSTFPDIKTNNNVGGRKGWSGVELIIQLGGYDELLS